MPSENSTRLAEQILDDLKCAAYYADSTVLGDVFVPQLGAERGSKTADASGLLGRLAHRYVKRHVSDADDSKELARWIEIMGIR